MPKAYQTYTKDELKCYDGKIVLYVDDDRDTKNFYYRFKDPLRPKRYVRKSSKTTELAIAKQRAIDHFNELMVKKTMGIVEAKTTFASLAERFKHELPSSGRYQMVRLLENYLQRYPEFGDNDISVMHDDALRNYLYWRQDPKNYMHHRAKHYLQRRTPEHLGKGVHSIAESTLKTEMKYVRFLIRRGFETGLVAKKPLMNFDYARMPHVSIHPSNRQRGRFTDEQLKHIERWRSGFAIAWANAHKKEDEGLTPTNWRFSDNTVQANRYNRCRFYMLITLCINTGIRPQECPKLRWCDIRLTKDGDEEYTWIDIRPEVAKKMRNGRGKHRTSICNNMETMWTRFEMWKREWTLRHGREPVVGTDPTSSDFVFACPTSPNKQGSHGPLIKAGLERISKERDFVVHGNMVVDPKFPEGKAWKQNTLYSFRSAYITAQLRNGTQLHHLSLGVGTAIPTLLKSYATDDARDYWQYFTNHVRQLRAKHKS